MEFCWSTAVGTLPRVARKIPFIFTSLKRHKNVSPIEQAGLNLLCHSPTTAHACRS